jgi:Stress responsive A/B Barrel Domain
MVRNVVLVELKADGDRESVSSIQDGLRELDCRGTISYTIGDDLGLREANWSFAIVADFKDEAAYRAYDLDAEHNRLRGLLAPHVERTARVQFAVLDSDERCFPNGSR